MIKVLIDTNILISAALSSNGTPYAAYMKDVYKRQNIDCKSVIYNDLDRNLLYLYNTFKNLDKQSVFDWIYEIINKYGLSLVSENGYDYYKCDSSKGCLLYTSCGIILFVSYFRIDTG